MQPCGGHHIRPMDRHQGCGSSLFSANGSIQVALLLCLIGKPPQPLHRLRQRGLQISSAYLNHQLLCTAGHVAASGAAVDPVALGQLGDSSGARQPIGQQQGCRIDAPQEVGGVTARSGH